VTSSILATTCNRLAVAAVTFNISEACTTRGWESSSTVVFADMDLVLNKLNTSEPFVIVRVIVSALPESSDTSIDFTMAVVAVAHVYRVVTLVEDRSTFAFTYVLGIN
jgi:hypothetical protein